MDGDDRARIESLLIVVIRNENAFFISCVSFLSTKRRKQLTKE
jgi:hypothetical protein